MLLCALVGCGGRAVKSSPDTGVAPVDVHVSQDLGPPDVPDLVEVAHDTPAELGDADTPDDGADAGDLGLPCLGLPCPLAGAIKCVDSQVVNCAAVQNTSCLEWGPPEPCDDGNLCTTDECSGTAGCLHSLMLCDDGDACTLDTCEAGGFCQHAPVSCDDANACTTDACSSAGNCQHSAQSCDDKDACTADACDPVAGCQHVAATDCCLLALGASCPEDMGFVCVTVGPRHTCENTTTGEAWIPAGVFWMGCNAAKEGLACYGPDEFPQHRVQLSQFAMNRLEVTAGEYDACKAVGWCTGPDPLADWAPEVSTWPTMPTFSMNFVTWWQAKQYCEWPDKPAGAQRLCTEAEWEKAARGSCVVNGCDEADDACCKVAMRSFPWGDALPSRDVAVMNPTWGNGNTNDNGCGTDFLWEPGQKPVGASPYGILDMSGNIAEWIYSGQPKSCPYPDDPGVTVVDPVCPPENGLSLRGGMYENAIYNAGDAQELRAGYRGGAYFSDDASPGYGIRCCRSIPGGP